MIIDGHAHIGHDIDGTTYDALSLLGEARNYKIDRIVIFPLNEKDPGICFSKANDLVSNVTSVFPFKFIGFARLNPLDKFAFAELNRVINHLKLRGIKLHPISQSFRMDDERLFKLVKTAYLYDLPVIFHTQKLMGYIDLLDAFDEFMKRMLKECPESKIIMGHSGMNFGVDDAIEIAKKYPRNIFLEISICKPDVIKEIVRSVNPNQIIFGTDLPYGRSKIIESAINLLTNEMNLEEGIKSKILGGNMARAIARDSYWKFKKEKQKLEMDQNNDEIGKCAVIDSKNPVNDIKGFLNNVEFSLVETAVYPIDFTAEFFITKIIYLYAWIDNFSLAFIGDEFDKKIYVFTPAIRFSEVFDGKDYLSEIVHEEDSSVFVDAPIDGIGSQEILLKVMNKVGWKYTLKSVNLLG